MRANWDWLAKQLVVGLLPEGDRMRSEYEVLTDAQRIDIWFDPSEATKAYAAQLGLLGRIVSEPCVLEFFHQSPGVAGIRGALRKQLSLHHSLTRQDPSRWRNPPALWIISSGRPARALNQFRFVPRSGWPAGVYSSLPVLCMNVVVVSELPEDRDSLIVRLLGAGKVFEKAAAELRGTDAAAFLPRDKLVRLVATAVAELRARHPQSKTVQEIAMKASELVAEYEAKLRQEGRAEGRTEGCEVQAARVRRTFYRHYEARFGDVPRRVRSVVEATVDAEQLSEWATLSASADEEQILAKILGPEAG